jgi:hypothetical protein
MKTAHNAIDQKAFNEFWERVEKEAERLFPNECGESLVRVTMQDRTRHERNCDLRVPRMDLAETEEDWLHIMSMLASQISSASNLIDIAIKLRTFDKKPDDKQRKPA